MPLICTGGVVHFYPTSSLQDQPMSASCNRQPKVLRLPSIFRNSVFLCNQNMRCGEGIHLLQADVNLKYNKEENM